MPALTLDALHREARELERAHRRGDPDALARVTPFRPDPAKPLKDAGALLVIARERGFPTWVKLQSYVERLDLGGEGLEHAFHTDMEYYEGRADGLLASARDRTPSAAAAFEGERVEMTPEGARVVVAQRHGFASWSALRRHVEGLAESGEPFARAYRALEERRHDDLAALLGQFPELARANGTNGNALINMASDAETLRLLLDAGADVAHPNAHGWTPLHQAAYGNRGDLAALLLDAGAPADVSARGAGGTPLIVALFWGHREVVDGVLLGAGRHPGNLRVAAGTGDVETIDAMVSADGVVSEAAGALRGFYRPHGGFPALGAGRRSAGDRRRGAVVGGARRSGRRARAAGRARRAGRRRRLPRHRADLGGGQRTRGGDRAAGRAGRRRQRPRDLRRPEPR